MNLKGTFFDEKLRSALRQTVAMTIPAEHVDLVVDVAVHAAEEALDALSRVVMGTPDMRVTITSSSVAVGILLHRLQEVQDAMKQASIATGHPYHEAMVTVQR